MKIEKLHIPGTYLITTPTHYDDRGFFREIVRTDELGETLGWVDGVTWAQSNVSQSVFGTVRGIHCSMTQAKLVTCVYGRAFDVMVDMRRDSPTFGEWQKVVLSPDSSTSVFMDAGIGHGFAASATDTMMSYMCTDTWSPESEITVNPLGLDLNIGWPVLSPRVSTKDHTAPTLKTLARENPTTLMRFEDHYA